MVKDQNTSLTCYAMNRPDLSGLLGQVFLKFLESKLNMDKQHSVVMYICYVHTLCTYL